MIKNYGLYNNHELDNTVLVLFSDKKIDKTTPLGEVDILYHELMTHINRAWRLYLFIFHLLL